MASGKRSPWDFAKQGTRELVAEDYVYAIKRLAHPRLHSPIFGMMADKIVGLKELGEALQKAAGEQLWVPGHGRASKGLLQAYGTFLAGIYEPCLQAVKDGLPEATAKAMVLKDPRVAARAPTMQGFDTNIGKYVSLAYLEAEKEAF